MPTKMKLTKEKVHYLYYKEKRSLAEIGKLGGVTRQRISQLMEEWSYPRRKPGKPGREKKFTDLGEYLKHSKKTGKQSYSVLRALVKPLMKECENCGAKTRLHIKYLRRPVKSLDDFKILCPVCLFAPCRKGIDGLKRKEIYRIYNEGKVSTLAKKYKVSIAMIYHILAREKKERLSRI